MVTSSQNAKLWKKLEIIYVTLKSYLVWTKKDFFKFCFDILTIDNRIENEINPGFYVKMKFRGVITRQLTKFQKNKFWARLWKNDVIKFYYNDHDFINLINNLWKFYINIILLSDAKSYGVKSVVFPHLVLNNWA